MLGRIRTSIGILLLLLFANAKSISNESHLNFKEWIQAIQDQKLTHFEATYFHKIHQFPNIQELVLADNPKALAALRNEPYPELMNSELIKLLKHDDFYSMHRLKINDVTKKIGLNAILNFDGGLLKNYLFENGDISTFSFNEKSLKMETVGGVKSRLKSITWPKPPFENLLKELLSVTASSDIEMLLKSLVDFRVASVDGVPSKGTSAFLANGVVSSQILFSEYGQLLEVISLRSDKPIRTILTVKYFSSDRDLFPDYNTPIPSHIEIRSEFLLNGEYKPYIIFTQKLISLSFKKDSTSFQEKYPVTINNEDLKQFLNASTDCDISSKIKDE